MAHFYYHYGHHWINKSRIANTIVTTINTGYRKGLKIGRTVESLVEVERTAIMAETSVSKVGTGSNDVADRLQLVAALNTKKYATLQKKRDVLLLFLKLDDIERFSIHPYLNLKELIYLVGFPLIIQVFS